MLLKILCAVIARLFLHEAFVFSVCPLLRQISLSYIDLSISYPPLHCLIKSFFYFIWLFLTLPHIYILPLIHLCRPFLLPPFAFFHSFEFLFTKISFLNFWLKIQNLYFGLLCFHPCYLLSYTLLFVYSHLFTLTILHTLSLSLSLSLLISLPLSPSFDRREFYQKGAYANDANRGVVARFREKFGPKTRSPNHSSPSYSRSIMYSSSSNCSMTKSLLKTVPKSTVLRTVFATNFLTKLPKFFSIRVHCIPVEAFVWSALQPEIYLT